MAFHTWVFFVFFVIVFPCYLLCRRNNQAMNICLMIASYTFYGWRNPWLILLLFSTSAIDFWMVLLMDRRQSTRKLWLIISLVSNFGFLGFFKYSKFITDNLNSLLTLTGLPALLLEPAAYTTKVFQFFGQFVGHGDDWIVTEIILPIGISFHTFQSMSYTIDAYFRTIEPERNFIRFLTFVSFFPQLVAGPIERAPNLLRQLQSTPQITWRFMADGMSLFLVGFFKKVALADYLGLYVNAVYGDPKNPDSVETIMQFQAPALILATIAFGWQIYFDFSGYTDMARGIAEFMGFRLMFNFNNPYTATGLGDFWNRWHISLSTWFKDYVYFPLGGSRRGTWMTYRNMFITMVVSGVWHGAEWGFVIWGALHALGRCLTREAELTPFYKERIPRLVKQLLVFAFVSCTWIFFRAQTLKKSWLIITRIFTTDWVDPKFPLGMAGLVLAVWCYQLLYSSESRYKQILEWRLVKFGIVAFMLVYLMLVAQVSTQDFIYMEF
jgi:D-alanyl-lipoteichoic acid acyltransferase DltB (MBOAT superfamily)